MNIEDKIIRTVAKYYNIDFVSIILTSQEGISIKARHLSMYFIRDITKMSFKKIGKHFEGRSGYKHYASIMHAIKSVNNQIDTDKRYRKEVDELSKLMNLLPYEVPETEPVFMENDYFI